MFMEIDVVDILGDFECIYCFVSLKLDGEYLWSLSMFCELLDEESILIVCYGSLMIGCLKYVYCKGLVLCYGKIMQCIVGIYYNFFLLERFWLLLCQVEGSELLECDYQFVVYIVLICNFCCYSWLLMYLFGVLLVFDVGFLCGCLSQLECFDEYMFYLFYVISLWMSDLGYQNNVQVGLMFCYNDLQSYIDSLCQVVSMFYLFYEKVGIKQDGEWVQLNINILQIENEYYLSIWLKCVIYIGECLVQVLVVCGVQYVEVCCLDINLFLLLGIDLDEVCFFDVFLLFCVFSDSLLLNGECSDVIDNFFVVVKEGRWLGL